MGLRTTIKYWHHPLSFGHIAIELHDTESGRTTYVSWANGNSEELDRHDFGGAPIEIELPETVVSYDELEAKIKSSPLHLSPEAVRFATSFCLKQIVFTDIPFKYRRELTNYSKSYQILTYNCAHAVEDVLIWGGYLEQRLDQYVLRPYSLIRYVLSELRIEIAYSKWLLLNAEKKLPDEKIKSYLSLILQRLEWKRLCCLTERFPSDVSELDADIALLKRLNFNSVMHTPDLIALTNLIQAVHLPTTAKQLREALSLIPPRQRYLTQIEFAIRILKQKAVDLAKRGFAHDSQVALQLATEITDYRRACFEEGSLSVAQFKQNVSASLSRAEPILSRHRGWKQVLTNLVLAVLGFGVGYLVAAACHKIATNRFFFLPQTDAKKCLELVERGLGLSKHVAGPSTKLKRL